jgi:hypothetical protein
MTDTEIKSLKEPWLEDWQIRKAVTEIQNPDIFEIGKLAVRRTIAKIEGEPLIEAMTNALLNEALFVPGTFLGCPVICKHTMLQAFDTHDDIHAFQARHCPGSSIERIGRCQICAKLHAEFKCRPPAGASSGTGRK